MRTIQMATKNVTTFQILLTRIVVSFSRKYLIILLLILPVTARAQERPEVFFREDFKETAAAVPITQDHIGNSNLLISLYGTAANQIKKSHHDTPADDPYYVWSGLCEGSWAITIKHKSQFVDLAQQGKIRWRSKQSGFRQLHILLKLANDIWLISDTSDSFSVDWRIREFNIQDIKWRSLDIQTMTEKDYLINPDLSKVEEIGWTDLMNGGGSQACSRVDWIEVDGHSVVK